MKSFKEFLTESIDTEAVEYILVKECGWEKPHDTDFAHADTKKGKVFLKFDENSVKFIVNGYTDYTMEIKYPRADNIAADIDEYVSSRYGYK